MDLLSTVLQSLRIVDSAIGLFELGAPWGFELGALSPQHVFVFEPLDNDFHLGVGGEAPVRVQRGDTALVLGGDFRMMASPAVHTLPLRQLWPDADFPMIDPPVPRGGPVRLQWHAPESARSAGDRIVTLALLLREAAHSPILDVLPRCIVLRHGTTPLYPWSEPMVRFVEIESHQDHPGYEAAAQLLAQLTIVELIRTYVRSVGTDSASWLKGISDPQIGRALALIYNEAGRDWRLETLAGACHMARSTFSRRFQQLVGRSPMEYLCSVRLHQAAQRLAAGERVQQVAAAVGYQSEWAFRRAFTAQFGLSPNRYRKQRPG